MAGSWGTLGFLTEVTFKVLPEAGAHGDAGCSAASTTRGAIEALSSALGSPFEVTGAAHLPGRDRQRRAHADPDRRLFGLRRLSPERAYAAC